MLAAIAGGLVFWEAQTTLLGMSRTRPRAEIEVVLPVFVQVALAGGDRYLAASWSSVRALVTETVRMAADEYRVLALVQRDVSWLNPAHEDKLHCNGDFALGRGG